MSRPDPRLSPKPSKYWGFEAPFHGVRRSFGAFGSPLLIAGGLVVAVLALWIAVVR